MIERVVAVFGAAGITLLCHGLTIIAIPLVMIYWLGIQRYWP